MVTLKTAICVHAQSSDLKFLNPVRNRVGRLLGEDVKICDLSDQISHNQALLILRDSPASFVVIFAHGSSDYLRGGEHRSRTTGEQVEIEKFITRKDLSVFAGKAVFCMSCESNGLAQPCLDAGAVAFVGFDDIPFNRFDTEGEPIGSHVLVKHCQELIVEAIQETLSRFLIGRASLEESVDYLRLWIAQKAVGYVRRMETRGVTDRKEVAALFLKVKAGVKYHGQRDVHFVRNG